MSLEADSGHFRVSSESSYQSSATMGALASSCHASSCAQGHLGTRSQPNRPQRIKKAFKSCQTSSRLLSGTLYLILGYPRLFHHHAVLPWSFVVIFQPTVKPVTCQTFLKAFEVALARFEASCLVKTRLNPSKRAWIKNSGLGLSAVALFDPQA